MKTACVAAAVLSCVGVVQGACPNLCSGHGNCDDNDQCVCYQEGKVLNKEGNTDEELLMAQWTGADCSQLSCPRGTSWTSVNGVSTHDKSMECSDAGICDRTTGQCACFETYTGSACQRTKCINDCSGHGVCTSNTDLHEDYAREMARNIHLRQTMPRCDGAVSDANCERDVSNMDAYFDTYLATYENAWDAGLHHGCTCDLGYTGNDCSLRECPSNFDPIDPACEAVQVDGSILPLYGDIDNLYTPWSTEGAEELLTDSQAAEYLKLSGEDQAFSEPTAFATMRRSNSDLARSCTAFHYDGTDGLDMTDNLVIYPVSTDSWVCSYLWDSNFLKVPYCGGRLAAQECSGRGLCDRESGQCTCFSGYTSRDCSETSNIV